MGLTQKLGTIPLAVFTDSSNNVGIGAAASGSYKLQVTGTTNLTGALSGTSATFSGRVSVNNAASSTNALEVLGSANNWGLSVTANTTTGQSYGGIIRGGTNSSDIAFAVNNAANNVGYFVVRGDGAATFSSSVTAGVGTFSTGTGTVISAKSSTGNGNASTAKIAITTSGEYGTISNKKYLDLDFVGYNNYPQARIRSWDESGSTGYGRLAFYTNPAGTDATNLAMLLDYNGNVGIGTSSPSDKLTIVGSVYVDGNNIQGSGDASLYINNTQVNDWGLIINKGSSGGDYGMRIAMPGASPYGYSIYNTTTSAESFRVQGNGDVKNTNNSYGAISDAKLKENITDATPKLNDLLKVKVRSYNLIGDDKKQIGVIAQELEKIFPNMVDEIKEKDSEDITKSVKYSVFVPMLIKAIQEQQEMINELKALIAAK